MRVSLFLFPGTATIPIYTLSLHDALPICARQLFKDDPELFQGHFRLRYICVVVDRKSTRLNSSHSQISYAVFCLKKKITNNQLKRPTGRASTPNIHHDAKTFELARDGLSP